jgi:hypothetical protein
VKNDFFVPFSPMATMSRSKSGSALLITDSCPLVIGSKEPGKTAILCIWYSFEPAKIRKKAG